MKSTPAQAHLLRAGRSRDHVRRGSHRASVQMSPRGGELHRLIRLRDLCVAKLFPSRSVRGKVVLVDRSRTGESEAKVKRIPPMTGWPRHDAYHLTYSNVRVNTVGKVSLKCAFSGSTLPKPVSATYNRPDTLLLRQHERSSTAIQP